MRIRCYEHKKMIAVKVAFPRRIPSGIGVRLGKPSFAVAIRNSSFPTVTQPLASQKGGGPYRSSVTGEAQVLVINKTARDRTHQELLLVKTKDKRKGMVRCNGMPFQEREQPGRNRLRIGRCFVPFLLTLFNFRFREPFFWRKVVGVRVPHARKEVIESTNPRSIPERETTKDSVQGISLE